MFRLITSIVFILIAYALTAQVSIEENPISIIPEISNNIDVDFKLAGGLILMNAENDGERGSYILDTGAPCLILNKVVGQSESKYLAVGVGGKKNVGESKINHFKLGKFTRKKIKCLSLDISHIERLKEKEIAGLIGYDMIKDKELLFDYDNLLVSFIEEERAESFKGQKRLQTLPFKMFGHMPIIHVKIGKKNFRFGIDTGAEVNVINANDAKKIDESLYEVFGNTNIQSVNDQKTNVNSIAISEITVSKKEKYNDLRFIITDLSDFNQAYGIQLDGLLGYSFLKDKLHSIDFRNKELVIWENHTKHFTLIEQ